MLRRHNVFEVKSSCMLDERSSNDAGVLLAISTVLRISRTDSACKILRSGTIDVLSAEVSTSHRIKMLRW